MSENTEEKREFSATEILAGINEYYTFEETPEVLQAIIELHFVAPFFVHECPLLLASLLHGVFNSDYPEEVRLQEYAKAVAKAQQFEERRGLLIVRQLQELRATERDMARIRRQDQLQIGGSYRGGLPGLTPQERATICAALVLYVYEREGMVLKGSQIHNIESGGGRFSRPSEAELAFLVGKIDPNLKNPFESDCEHVVNARGWCEECGEEVGLPND